MKARNQSSSPVSSTMMRCPVSGPVQMLEYEKARQKACELFRKNNEKKFAKAT